MNTEKVLIDVLFGHIEMHTMPVIWAGRLFGYPHEIIHYDRDGNVRDVYYTPPAVWASYG